MRVAAGEGLPLEAPGIDGHAIEVRVYAEDPARDFMPAIGRLVHLRAPVEGAHVRVDTGVREGDAITVHYDPMIAKLIVWDTTRAGAVVRLRRALAGYEAVGVTTNLGLLRRIAGHAAFAAGGVDTGFIGRHEGDLLGAAGAAPLVAVAAAAAHVVRRGRVVREGDLWSPWARGDAWRMNGDGHRKVVLLDGETEVVVRVRVGGDGVLTLVAPGGEALERDARVMVGGVQRAVGVVEDGGRVVALVEGEVWGFGVVDRLAAPEVVTAGAGRVVAPMPGRIVSVSVGAGQAVVRGEVLLVLEAMKVQMRIAAPRDGVVGAVHAGVGALVEEGAELVVLRDELG